MGSEHPDRVRSDNSGDAELKALLAALDEDDLNPADPPSGLWNRIAAEISDNPAPATTPGLVDVNATSPNTSAGISNTEATTTTTTIGSSVGSARRNTWFGLAAAAAVVLAVAGVATWLATRTSSRIVATAQLQYEADFDPAGASAAASAELIERDGMYLISLRDPDLPNELGEPADLELWLIEADADGNLDVQPVAVIDQGDGTYAVPDGLNPTTHNIVDISIEPRDGDATHSGRSILRGTLVEV